MWSVSSRGDSLKIVWNVECFVTWGFTEDHVEWFVTWGFTEDRVECEVFRHMGIHWRSCGMWSVSSRGDSLKIVWNLKCFVTWGFTEDRAECGVFRHVRIHWRSCGMELFRHVGIHWRSCGMWSVSSRGDSLKIMRNVECFVKWISVIIFRRVLQNCEKRLLASSCLYVRPRGKTRLSLAEFSWNLIFEYFSKISINFHFH